jgi:two-component system, NtrC family, response regulator GlrR
LNACLDSTGSPTGEPTDPLAALRRAGLVGHSERFVAALARLPRFARCDAGVLILGETGTGKEVCAQALHYASARAGGPFVAVNCAAIPAELVEDELFGHVRGAYTHAHAARSGLVAEAEQGTLFLDEIDALPLAAQAKLLRFVQDQQYRPVGSSQLRQAHVRLVAASNRPLDVLAAQGQFRQDLLFRLNMLTLQLPPLRERMADVPALAQHFLALSRREGQHAIEGLDSGALARLMAWPWPGNVRELKHTVDRAALLAAGPLLQEADLDLGPPGQSAAPGLLAEGFNAAKARAVRDFERHYIECALAEAGGNIAQAARLAHKHRRAFFELMRKHEIQRERYRH